MNVDDYLLTTPPDYEKENTCKYCGEPCNKDFCSAACVKYYLED